MNFKHLTLALAATLSIGTVQAQSLVLTPSSKDVSLGDTFTLQVAGKDFATQLVGGGFNLSFTAGLLELSSVAIDAGWELSPQGGLIDNASGTLTGAAFTTFVAPKAGDFSAATLTFKAIGPGIATIALAASSTFPFTDIDVNAITPHFGSATITSSSVPEPSSVALALAGVLLVRTASRRQSRG
jgi:predicted anti-sigma-YlaC factor YlaD